MPLLVIVVEEGRIQKQSILRFFWNGKRSPNGGMPDDVLFIGRKSRTRQPGKMPENNLAARHSRIINCRPT